MTERLVRGDYACQLCRMHQNRGTPSVTSIAGSRLCALHLARTIEIRDNPSPTPKRPRINRRRVPVAAR